MDDSVERESVTSEESNLFLRLKAWFRADREHSAEWRTHAEEDFDFVAGRQWTTQEEQILRDERRPPVVFNRVQPIVDVVCGQEVSNRQEVRFIPRTIDDATLNERMTEAARWFRDLSDAEDEDSDAFRDAVICGMGWSETRFDADEDPEGKPLVERIDPFEMYWDCSARRANLVDARRVWRVRRMPKAEAERLFPDVDDALLNAKWASPETADEDSNINDRQFYDNDQNTPDKDEDKFVTLAECQWYETETAYSIALPDGTTTTASEKEALAIKEKFPEIIANKTTRRAYKRAFLGSEVLEVGPAPCGDHFTFNCITGKRDRNKGVWYGIVRPMKDPQRWANKWLSQAMHILNSNAKGGIFAEEDAFADKDDAEKTYAKSDQITWVKKNALVAGKIQPKVSPPVPAGFFDLMNFAVSSVRDTSGVSVEMIGAQEANQAASLEYQRRQTSLTILATLFDSLRRYRKMAGRVLLYIIQNQISPERMVRITSDNSPSFAPITPQMQSAVYDIIIDESPTSPNQKEQAWQIMQQLLPVVGSMMTPKMWSAVLEYSPLPSSVSQEFRKAMEEGAANPPPDPEAQKMQMQMQLEQAKAQAAQAKEAAQMQADLAVNQQTFQAEMYKTDAEMQFKYAQLAQQREIELLKLGASDKEIVDENGGIVRKAQSKEDKQGEMIMQGFQSLGAMLERMTQAQNAPKMIVRDENGRAAGVQSVNGMVN